MVLLYCMIKSIAVSLYLTTSAKVPWRCEAGFWLIVSSEKPQWSPIHSTHPCLDLTPQHSTLPQYYHVVAVNGCVSCVAWCCYVNSSSYCDYQLHVIPSNNEEAVVVVLPYLSSCYFPRTSSAWLCSFHCRVWCGDMYYRDASMA